jgi:3-oxoacyl-[acyl-carrier-protein] synthase-3
VAELDVTLPVPTGAGPAACRTLRAGVAGVGRALPGRVVGNHEIAVRIGVDSAWIERRTGIRERRFADGFGDRVSDLATAAARRALADARVDADEIDLVLVATLAPDELTPNTAPLVAHDLGTAAAAIDVGAACTGFLSALALASGQIESGRARNALVIGAEVMSRFLDRHDRRTAPLFGDGAGAVVLAPGAGAVGPVVLRSAGEYAPLIQATHEEQLIRMEGHDTFLAAVSFLCDSTVDACAEADVAVDEVDLFVFHQANARILGAVADRLQIDPDRVVDAIGDLGNTSAASLPLALAIAGEDGRLRTGDRVLLGAVGAGFTYGATILDWGRA